MPIFSILPFKPGEVPDGWIEFKGQFIGQGEFPELYEAIKMSQEANGLWEDQFNAEILVDGLILPDPTYEQAALWSMGVSLNPPPPCVLAIKVYSYVPE